ncbi:23S rRNA (guanine(745)-N(1))-methyltransferase [bacterium (Candidatus Blackallbacteria) CG17_big_fil_post_rev_8_21_14_2_50_48_46]|uniref:23S rRNA (Guanine(745)-N(1))-methyltransferase n=1 Tax=bacterium (Candidatus Blackallbacteria) CG17_big_fil_post_rev_8_21_14_2_50_48_46 TaxID=2014261 RepID=A0A2M7FYJ4_9BACT|nr:MAG: 23S rRNA (guanine(745)-N(1))-methyltransferase [bacterium (Candidatus Blackallbacteria) CG18_big_fil_WC_8_21_14_2_50_49_26]PIW14235.1 MAG: 23S rRNA (guanine(745)-N(1))-methyltransferase [bacterium (Candidatus Blackallbacteria) CG17_big_fil_post_rev_8_21_14_2_50_48_46]PIW46960.1 MAG: 23S rRNA (guanine(745)-N(1))-methyltransferase [bacterium (Candidatus Blackallbacteria) CG13_big_fil_rev_8_21_14_2_50_49_14]
MQFPFQFKCPVCHTPLNPEGRSFFCPQRHTFDLAKQGYLNLLLAQNKRSRQPGDSDEMIQNRQKFLNAGYYRSLAEAVVDLLQALSAQKILDMGCGEGYYLQALRSGLGPQTDLAGVDISKFAVLQAAKRKLNAQLAVASSYALPFFENGFDTLLSIFAPLSASEALRLLPAGGRVLMVGPGPIHLQGLMAEIYQEVFLHQGNFEVLEGAAEFKLEQQLEVRSQITVAGEDILPLLTMTPYYFHTPLEHKHKLMQLPQLETPIDFELRVYQRL